MHRRMLAALAIALLPAPALAATLIENARGIQIAADGKLDRFTGLVINDQGKVVQVLRGSCAGVVVPIDRRVDVGGRALLPGLIDAHGHVMAMGLAALQLDLVGTSSVADLQQRLRSYAAREAERRVDRRPRLEPGTVDGQDVSRPPPISTLSWPTGRWCWSASTGTRWS